MAGTARPSSGRLAIHAKALASWLAFPVYAWQGVGVRLRTPRLLPAKGGTRGRIAGSEPEVRLLALGESSAAAVGIACLDDGIAACLAREINKRTGRAVFYRAAGFNSATAAQLRDHAMPHLEPRDWAHVVLTVGVNDTKNFNTGGQWKKSFGELLYALRARFADADIFWSEILPFDEVPAMPHVLGRILETRAHLVNQIANALCAERGIRVIPRMTGLDREDFCEDGFHASEIGYAGWAVHIVGHMEIEAG